jgi:hypothetical protein
MLSELWSQIFHLLVGLNENGAGVQSFSLRKDGGEPSDKVHLPVPLVSYAYDCRTQLSTVNSGAPLHALSIIKFSPPLVVSRC